MYKAEVSEVASAALSSEGSSSENSSGLASASEPTGVVRPQKGSELREGSTLSELKTSGEARASTTSGLEATGDSGSSKGSDSESTTGVG
ncbi:hypothetical protein Tco_1041509 [Tanacetum coccineum]|uniref:Uncharacterized protein n=1 Tax=Tanacetum coccineum TaxID=301880 RepID=A0ABQ5GH38_9ASTR